MLNLPLIGVWVALLRVPYRLMFPMIVLFCCIGTYSVGNTVFDIWVMLLFGVLGVFFTRSALSRRRSSWDSFSDR